MLSLVENLFLKTNPLQDLLSSLNAAISTNESTWFTTGHMVYNLAYTYILQTTTSLNPTHDKFLEWWNITKSLSETWHQFLMSTWWGYCKKCKKLQYHDNMQANPAPLMATFCPALLSWSTYKKSTIEIRFFT